MSSKDFTGADFKNLKKGNDKCRGWLRKNGYKEELWPKIKKTEESDSEGLAEAFSIMGIEKYLGNADKAKRIAYFPQIKMSHDSAKTVAYVKFVPELKSDVCIVKGKIMETKDMKGMDKFIEKIRAMTGLKTHFVLVSDTIEKAKTDGKGLGTSAAAAGAIAAAFSKALFPDLMGNKRFVGVLSRYFSGSGTSSVAGGFSIWLSHKHIADNESYAVRFDKNDVDIRIVTVPIPSLIKTEEAHGAAEASEFYRHWALQKPEKCLKLMEHVKNNDVKSIGRIAELDSINLFHLFVSGGQMFNWEPDTLSIFRKICMLRKESGITAYACMDTGPSIAIITTKSESKEVKKEIESYISSMGKKWPVYFADMAGSPNILPVNKRNIVLNSSMKEILEEKGIEL